MTKEEWEKIRYFNPDELWGDPDKMSCSLLLKLDALRQFCSHLIYILRGYATSGHSENSQHYLGRGTDCFCPSLDPVDFYLAAERFKFNGIGLYYPEGFLHLDTRVLGENLPMARWGRINCDGEKNYVKLEWEFLKLFLEPSERVPGKSI